MKNKNSKRVSKKHGFILKHEKNLPEIFLGLQSTRLRRQWLARWNWYRQKSCTVRYWIWYRRPWRWGGSMSKKRVNPQTIVRNQNFG